MQHVHNSYVLYFGAAQFRLSGADLQKYQNSEASFNSQYGASIKTEHAFNGLGILDVVRATEANRCQTTLAMLAF